MKIFTNFLRFHESRMKKVKNFILLFILIIPITISCDNNESPPTYPLEPNKDKNPPLIDVGNPRIYKKECPIIDLSLGAYDWPSFSFENINDLKYYTGIRSFTDFVYNTRGISPNGFLYNYSHGNLFIREEFKNTLRTEINFLRSIGFRKIAVTIGHVYQYRYNGPWCRYNELLCHRWPIYYPQLNHFLINEYDILAKLYADVGVTHIQIFNEDSFYPSANQMYNALATMIKRHGLKVQCEISIGNGIQDWESFGKLFSTIPNVNSLCDIFAVHAVYPNEEIFNSIPLLLWKQEKIEISTDGQYCHRRYRLPGDQNVKGDCPHIRTGETLLFTIQYLRKHNFRAYFEADNFANGGLYKGYWSKQENKEVQNIIENCANGIM